MKMGKPCELFPKEEGVFSIKNSKEGELRFEMGENNTVKRALFTEQGKVYTLKPLSS